jgi:hypothetical protein
VALFLVLATPFIVYVEHQGYGLDRPDVLIVVGTAALIASMLGAASVLSPIVGAAALAAALAFFADIQSLDPGLTRLGLLFLVLCGVLWVLRRHAAALVSLVMAIVLAPSLLAPRTQAVSGGPAPVAGGDLPLVVHLVLDEHIGLEGLQSAPVPDAFSRGVESFFVDRGFRLFARAYSEHDSTVPSIGHLLNLAPGRLEPDLSVPGRDEGTYRLTRNAYFARLARQGYAITVYQPDVQDMCTDVVPRAACHTYEARSLRTLDRLAVSPREKVLVVAGTFLNRSEAYLRTKRMYQDIRLELAGRKLALPAWSWERGTATPVGTMPLFDRLTSEVSSAVRGRAIFAHLLMPHYPYVYDAACVPRPPSQWRSRWSGDDVEMRGARNNTPESRAERYALYAQQVTCVQRQLARVIDAVPAALRADAVIVIQGDHGSRISLVEAVAANAGRAAPSDYADHFSTLFAIRSPALHAGTDPQAVSIACLVRTLAESGFSSTAAAAGCSTPPRVFVRRAGALPQPHELPGGWMNRDGGDTAAR